jgi:hypothetical protein
LISVAYGPPPALARRRQRAEERIKAGGPCSHGHCKAPLKPGHRSLCVDHAQVRSESVLARRDRLIEEGLCVTCGQAPATETQRCHRCAVRWRGQHAKARARRHQRGICQKCPKPVAKLTGGKSGWWCQGHLERTRRRNHRRAA